MFLFLLRALLRLHVCTAYEQVKLKGSGKDIEVLTIALFGSKETLKLNVKYKDASTTISLRAGLDMTANFGDGSG